MGKVYHEINGTIDGIKLENRELDGGRLGIRVGQSLRISNLS